MGINSKVFAIALIFGATVTPAMAEGFYGALDIGQAKAKDGCTGLPAGMSGCQDTTTLYRIAGGYQFVPMWGAEISYGASSKESAGTGAGISSSDWQGKILQLSGTGTFPLGEAFSLIGKLGIARTELKVNATVAGNSLSQSATSTKFAYGIGAQYDFTKSISARAQYEDLGNVGDSNTGTSKVTLLSAGVVFKF